MRTTIVATAVLLAGGLVLAGSVSAIDVTVPIPPGEDGDGEAYVHAGVDRREHYAYDCYHIDGEVWLESGDEPGLQRWGENRDELVVDAGPRYDYCIA